MEVRPTHLAVNSKKKRRRDAEEEEPTQNQVMKSGKRRRRRDRTRRVRGRFQPDCGSVEERSKEDKKQKKKKEEKMVTKTTASSRTLSHLVHRTLSDHSQRGQKHQEGSSCHSSISVNGKATAKTQNGETDSCSDSSGSSSEEEAPSKKPHTETTPKSPSLPLHTPVASKATQSHPIVKPPTPNKKPRPPPSSSDSDSDSSDDELSSKATTGKPPRLKPNSSIQPAATPPTTTGSDAGPRDKTTPSEPRPSLPSSGPMNSVSPGQRLKLQGQAQSAAQKAPRRPESSDSSGGSSSEEEEIQLVINGQAWGWGGPSSGSRPHLERRGRKPRSAERGGDHAGFYFNYEGGQRQQNNHQQLPSYQNDSLINNSVVFQNPSESVTRRDYSEMPLLAAPPQVGQKIAFKLLELTENYTPEVSEYKEGKIIHFDHSTKQIELELLSAYQAPVEPGKFDLVYQNADGSESVEYAVSRGSRVTERWDSLLEPRLVVGNLG
ncbi:coilin-like [Coregonus clupeaformis]|uniref:coilin-like n=1 Tax=Coregonus clupeaformis TaxID=59861 RepID=UPI001E1C3B1F|nr:coilin-like [Coregonus clupeaformis]